MNFETNIKGHYIRHLKRKKPCKNLNNIECAQLLSEIQNKSYINRSKVVNDPKKYTILQPDVNIASAERQPSVSQMSAKCQPCVSQTSAERQPSVSQMSAVRQPNVSHASAIEEKSIFYCQYCEKEFKHRQSKFKHEKNCGNKEINNLNNKSSILSDDDVKAYIMQLVNENDRIKQEKRDWLVEKRDWLVEKKNLLVEKEKMEVEKEKMEVEKEKMRDEIKELTRMIGNINNYQININSYGKENLKYITTDFITQLIKIPYASVPKLIEHIHFNPDHPENHNIKIPNKRDKFALVCKDGSWEHVNKKNLIEDMVDKGYNMLDCYMAGDTLILHDKKRENFMEFQHKYETQKKVRKSVCNDTELVILNGQEDKPMLLEE